MDKRSNCVETDGDMPLEDDPTRDAAQRHTGSGMSKSMHDGVDIWCDCCSCEAEPYWIEAMQNYRDSAGKSKA